MQFEFTVAFGQYVVIQKYKEGDEGGRVIVIDEVDIEFAGEIEKVQYLMDTLVQ